MTESTKRNLNPYLRNLKRKIRQNNEGPEFLKYINPVLIALQAKGDRCGKRMPGNMEG